MPSAPPTLPCRFVLVGAGRVGTSVAKLLTRSGGEPIAVWSRSARSAGRAAALISAPVCADIRFLPRADLILVGTTEGAIRTVVDELAPRLEPGEAVVHFAGSLGLRPLEGAARAGAAVFALHPVQACPDVPTALRRLPGSAWGVTCADPHRPWAHHLVSGHLKGVPVDVAEGDRPIWHAASVTTANGISALLAAAERMLRAVGVADPPAVLSPLAAGAAANAAEGGGGGATLTGPLVRGELETIERHLDALRAADPGLAETYVDVARVILGSALRESRIDPAAADSMLSRLERS